MEILVLKFNVSQLSTLDISDYFSKKISEKKIRPRFYLFFIFWYIFTWGFVSLGIEVRYIIYLIRKFFTKIYVRTKLLEYTIYVYIISMLSINNWRNTKWFNHRGIYYVF